MHKNLTGTHAKLGSLLKKKINQQSKYGVEEMVLSSLGTMDCYFGRKFRTWFCWNQEAHAALGEAAQGCSRVP